MSNMCPIAHVSYHPYLPSRSILYYAQFQKDPWSISQDPCRTRMHPLHPSRSTRYEPKFLCNSQIYGQQQCHEKQIQITWHQGPLTKKVTNLCPHFCPSKDFLILTLHTLSTSLDWLDHSHHFWSSNPSTNCAVAHRKKCMMSQFETVNRKNSQKVHFGS